MADAIEPNAIVTVESGGRTLSGAGVSAEQLQETVDSHEERHAPADAPAKESAPVPSGSAPATGEVPKQTRGQARFSELTQARKDAEAKAEAAERKAAELEARLSQAQPPAAQTPQAQQRQEPAVPSQAQPTRPKPSEDDIGTTYPTYADFVEDLSDWKTEQRLAAQDMRAAVRDMLKAEREAATFDTHVEAVRSKGRTAYKDFDAMLKSGPGTFVDMPMPAIKAILNHPASEHLQYKIMSDGALAQKLAQLAFTDAYNFAFELAKLAPAEPPSNGHRPQQNIPAPMQPVGSGSRSSTPTSAEHAASGNYEAYKAARAAERKGRR